VGSLGGFITYHSHLFFFFGRTKEKKTFCLECSAMKCYLLVYSRPHGVVYPFSRQENSSGSLKQYSVPICVIWPSLKVFDHFPGQEGGGFNVLVLSSVSGNNPPWRDPSRRQTTPPRLVRCVPEALCCFLMNLMS
jgi:hypothetical protein